MRLKKVNRYRKHRNYCWPYFRTVRFVVQKKMCLIAKIDVAETRLTSSPKHLFMSMSVGLIWTKLNSVAWVRERTNRPSDRRLSVKLVLTFADRGSHMVNVTDPYGRILGFSRQEPLLFLSSSSTVVLMRLSGPRFRPNTSQKIW
jgi:CBS-domain-containing membrane protein